MDLTMNDPAPRAGVVARTAAGLAGVVALLIAALFTVGTAFAAPIGVALAAWMMRRRGRALSLARSWMAAAAASTAAVALGFGLLFASLPSGTFTSAIAEAQKAEQPPPPAWLERIAPGSTRPNPATERIVKSAPFTLYAGMMGGVLAVVLIGSIAGSAGWGATLLLGYAGKGRW